MKNASPDKKMLDIDTIRNIQDITVGDVFNYKNLVVMKIKFRSVIKNSKVIRKLQRFRHARY
jgi:hypothetical protein